MTRAGVCARGLYAVCRCAGVCACARWSLLNSTEANQRELFIYYHTVIGVVVVVGGPKDREDEGERTRRITPGRQTS